MLWQVGGWCQDMCLNRARQRRRHRRAIEDWFHLSEHAISADGSPGFQDWLHSPASPWQWPPEQEEGQVRLMQNPVFAASRLQRAHPTLVIIVAQVMGFMVYRVLSLWVVGMNMGCRISERAWDGWHRGR